MMKLKNDLYSIENRIVESNNSKILSRKMLKKLYKQKLKGNNGTIGINR
jgi:hypothetical protein